MHITICRSPKQPLPIPCAEVGGSWAVQRAGAAPWRAGTPGAGAYCLLQCCFLCSSLATANPGCSASGVGLWWPGAGRRGRLCLQTLCGALQPCTQQLHPVIANTCALFARSSMQESEFSARGVTKTLQFFAQNASRFHSSPRFKLQESEFFSEGCDSDPTSCPHQDQDRKSVV